MNAPYWIRFCSKKRTGSKIINILNKKNVFDVAVRFLVQHIGRTKKAFFVRINRNEPIIIPALLPKKTGDKIYTMSVMKRLSNDPILKPSDIKPSRSDLEVVGVFNPAACMVGDEIVLILRVAEAAVPETGWLKVPVVTHQDGRAAITVKAWRTDALADADLSDARHFILDGTRYLSSLSHFRVARSRDGLRFEVASEPFMIPEMPTEAYGIEDPRAVWIDGRCYITCTAVFEDGFGVLLSSTGDLNTVERHGFIFPPENKNCCLFPEKVGNKYVALHRPIVKDFGKPCVWYAESPDLLHWGNSSCLLHPSGGYQGRKIGSGPGPIKTDDGWLYLYHGVDDNETYRLFLALLDADDPRRVLFNRTIPLLEPEMAWERGGFVPNVVFSNGWIRRQDDTVLVYYGAADTAVGVAAASLRELLDWVEESP